MKRHFFLKVIAALCLLLLTGCGAPAEEKPQPEPETEETPVVQELTAAELQQYFEKTYEAKGNCLDTPEQLALEAAELEALTANAVLPEDYEAQYQTWRSEKVKSTLEALQAQYDEIIDGLSLNAGPIPGACYANYVDFEGDGCPELLVISLKKIPNYGGIGATLQAVAEVYVSIGGNPKEIWKIWEKEISDLIRYSGIGLCKAGELPFLHIYHDGADDYYNIKNGSFSILDNAVCYDPREIGYYYYTFDEEISEEEYNSIQSKYSETEYIVTQEYSTPTVKSRGILPQPSPDVLHRAALIEALDNSHAQYARLADMDGDGVEDLLVAVEGEYEPIFRAYTWNGSETQAVDIAQGESASGIGGIYREKSTGKIYANYYGGVGPYSWDYFERISEIIEISDEELSWEEYEAQKDRFELVEDLMWQLPKYDTVEAVRNQLISG